MSRAPVITLTLPLGRHPLVPTSGCRLAGRRVRHRPPPPLTSMPHVARQCNQRQIFSPAADSPHPVCKNHSQNGVWEFSSSGLTTSRHFAARGAEGATRDDPAGATPPTRRGATARQRSQTGALLISNYQAPSAIVSTSPNPPFSLSLFFFFTEFLAGYP